MPHQTKTPTSSSQSGSGVSWANLFYSHDGNNSTYASANLAATYYTQVITYSNLGFSIPSSSVITGIRTYAIVSASASRTISCGSQVTIGSRSNWKSASGTGTYTPFGFGGQNDLWGFSPAPTPSEVNNSFQFTISLSVNNHGVYLYLHEVGAEVYYQPASSDSGTAQASTESVSISLPLSEPVLLSGSDSLTLTISGSEAALLLGPEDLPFLSRGLREPAWLEAVEAPSTQASLGSNESSPLIALEASGLLFPSEESDFLSGLEGVLVQSFVPGTDPGSLFSSEIQDLLAELSAQDPLLLEGQETPSLQALLSSLETGGIVGEGEGAGILVPVSDLFPLLGEEEAGIWLSLSDLLSIPATDLLPRLIRVLDPRASIAIEGPRATIMVLEEGRRLVERIYRGTEAAVILRFSSSVGRYYDPLSVQFLVRRPSGAVSNPSVQRIGPGTYRAELRFDEPGIWVLRAEGTDPLRAVTEKRIEVIGDL
jgi:hypothetical protein